MFIEREGHEVNGEELEEAGKVTGLSLGVTSVKESGKEGRKAG